MTQSGAFSELRGSSPVYAGAAARRPYDKDNISWPPEGTLSVDGVSLMSGEAARLLRDWQSCLLRPADEVGEAMRESGVQRPFVGLTLDFPLIPLIFSGN